MMNEVQVDGHIWRRHVEQLRAAVPDMSSSLDINTRHPVVTPTVLTQEQKEQTAPQVSPAESTPALEAEDSRNQPVTTSQAAPLEDTPVTPIPGAHQSPAAARGDPQPEGGGCSMDVRGEQNESSPTVPVTTRSGRVVIKPARLQDFTF